MEFLQIENYLFLHKESNSPKLFFDIKKRILSKENILIDYIDNSTYGYYVGFITNNGKIHYHKDTTIPGYDHIRFNLFLSIQCEIVKGDIPRIVISYGIYLKQKNNLLTYQ